MNRPAVSLQKLSDWNLPVRVAFFVFAPGNQRVIQHHETPAGAEYFEQVIEPFGAGCGLQIGMGLLDAGLG